MRDQKRLINISQLQFLISQSRSRDTVTLNCVTITDTIGTKEKYPNSEKVLRNTLGLEALLLRLRRFPI